MASPLQRHIELAGDRLARQLARKASLEQALKDSLLTAATSPAALLTAFSTGALLARCDVPESPAAAGGGAGKSRFAHLLQQAGLATNWLTLIPLIVSAWHNVRRGPPTASE